MDTRVYSTGTVNGRPFGGATVTLVHMHRALIKLINLPSIVSPATLFGVHEDCMIVELCLSGGKFDTCQKDLTLNMHSGT